MLREAVLKKCLKAVAHLLAINEPFELRGRMRLVAGAIQREHVATRVHLFLSGYLWPFFR